MVPRQLLTRTTACRATAVHIQELRQRVTEALAGYSSPIPTDGTASLAFNSATNRITTAAFDYDKAGNQVRALAPGGGSQRFQYDAANRLVKVKADDNVTVLATYTYGDSTERLIADEGGVRTYYASDGGTALAEYTESGSSTTPLWSKSYIYLGARLLSTLEPNGSGAETVRHHHPDSLGTRLVTSPADGSYFEQVSLPFGTALNAESTGSTNRRFTSYDRSSATGLDYAINRHYDSQQGRFTQVDPIGMKSVSLTSPQTLNLYAYCSNDPINHTDPSGLGFFSFLKKVFKGIGKILTNKWVLLVVGIAAGIGAGLAFYWAIKEAGGALVGFFIKAGIVLAGTSATLIAAAFHPNIQRYAQIIGGIASTAQGILGLLNGPRVFGTPPWNPNSAVGPVSHFMQTGETERALTQAQRDFLFNVLEAAKAALRTHPECMKFVGAGADLKIDYLWGKGLFTYFHGRVARAGQQPTWAVTRYPGWFSRGGMVLLFDFFNTLDHETTQEMILGITPYQDRVLTILHEVRHYNLGIHGHPGPDWDATIAEKCF